MPKAAHLDWEHLYLLGWYDINGKAYLTTWEGDLPFVDVVVKFTNPNGPPLWKAKVGGATLHVMPENLTTIQQKVDFAKTIGGVYAFGWYLEEGFKR